MPLVSEVTWRRRTIVHPSEHAFVVAFFRFVPFCSFLFLQIFPRFYFVSNVALLDMLANGTNPPKIMPYLGDCYDSLANLTFITLEDGTTSSKTVNEMVSNVPAASLVTVSHKHGKNCPFDSRTLPHLQLTRQR